MCRVVFDQLDNASNVAAALRTAECYGIHHVHVIAPQGSQASDGNGTATHHNGSLKSRLRGWYDVSKGASTWTRVHVHSSPEACVAALRQAGFAIAALALAAESVPVTYLQQALMGKSDLDANNSGYDSNVRVSIADAACEAGVAVDWYLRAQALPLVLEESSSTSVLGDATIPVALVFGNEKRGVSSHVLDLADAVVRVPMYGMSQSLNVAAAVAAALSALDARNMIGRGDMSILEFEQTLEALCSAKCVRSGAMRHFYDDTAMEADGGNGDDKVGLINPREDDDPPFFTSEPPFAVEAGEHAPGEGRASLGHHQCNRNLTPRIDEGAGGVRSQEHIFDIDGAKNTTASTGAAMDHRAHAHSIAMGFVGVGAEEVAKVRAVGRKSAADQMSSLGLQAPLERIPDAYSTGAPGTSLGAMSAASPVDAAPRPGAVGTAGAVRGLAGESWAIRPAAPDESAMDAKFNTLFGNAARDTLSLNASSHNASESSHSESERESPPVVPNAAADAGQPPAWAIPGRTIPWVAGYKWSHKMHVGRVESNQATWEKAVKTMAFMDAHVRGQLAASES